MSVIVPHYFCTEVDHDHNPVDTKGGQALFNATGLIGVSEPDDNEEVEDGDILDDVVNPNGKLVELEVAEALVNTEAVDCAAIKLAPRVLW